MPISHRLQLGRGATEAPYWLAVSCGRHSHLVRFVADINPCSVGMDDFQTEIFALDSAASPAVACGSFCASGLVLDGSFLSCCSPLA
jgi:hypothetical protein